MSKVPSAHWIFTPEAQISICFALQPAIFEWQACRNSECPEWPQNDLNHWSVKSTLCTLDTHPRGPNFPPFHSTTSRFWDTGFSKIGNAPNDPRMTFKQLTVKSTPCTLNTPSRGPNFNPFSSTTSQYRVTGLSKLTLEAQISLCYTLAGSLVFQIIKVSVHKFQSS